VDLAALAICWLAVVFLFAGAVLQAKRCRAEAARCRRRMLLRARRIAYWLLGIALVGIAFWNSPQESAGGVGGDVAGPGADLGGLCDTARPCWRGGRCISRMLRCLRDGAQGVCSAILAC
jgi:hypothetical protein